MWGTVGAPAPQVLCVEAPADVLWGAVGEGSRRYSTGNNTIYPIALVGWQVIQAGKIQLRVVQLPILYFLCCVLGVQGKEGNRARDCHSAVHGVDRSATRPAVQWGGL